MFFIETGGARIDRQRDQVFYNAGYLDEDARGALLAEIRVRINECQASDRTDLTDVRPSLNNGIDGAEQRVGYLATLTGTPDEGVVALGCEVALVDAVVVKVCLLLATDGDGGPLQADEVAEQDQRVNEQTRDLMEAFIARARDQQARVG